MNRRELENGINEDEAIDAESRKLAVMLGALPRVESPANFEFGVKAKIAAGVTREPRSNLLPFFKIAAPLSIVLVVATLVVFYGGYPDIGDVAVKDAAPTDSRPVETTSEVVQPERDEVSRGPQIDEPMIESESPTLGPANTPQPRRNARKRQQNGSAAQTPRGGSFVEALGEPKTIDPPGFQRRGVSNQNSDFSTEAEVSVREVLQTIGIDADFADGGWRVRSAADRSVSGRSGVRAGDFVEAIDDKVLTETTVFRGMGSGKTLRVRRDGKQLTLNLRN